MTQENQKLLLKDLSARLPYGVKVQVTLPWANDVEFASDIKIRRLNACLLNVALDHDNPVVKPYLRHKSDMTDEEKKTYRTLQDAVCSYHYEFGDIVDDYVYVDNYASLDYLNSIHVDYRGMIDNGLAYRAPNGMYNIN